MSAVAFDPIRRLIEVRAAVRDGSARKARQDAGLSQAEVAATVGVTPACVSRWESGARRPTGPAAQRYAQLLDLLDRERAEVERSTDS